MTKKYEAKISVSALCILQEWRWASWRTHSHTSALSAILLRSHLCTLRSAETLLYLARALLMHWSKMSLESLLCGLGYKMGLKWCPSQVPGYMLGQERRSWRDYSPPEQHSLPPAHHHGSQADIPYGQCHYLPPFSRPWSASQAENGEILILYAK